MDLLHDVIRKDNFSALREKMSFTSATLYIEIVKIVTPLSVPM